MAGYPNTDQLVVQQALHEEVPTVDKTVTPRERVRLGTETHSDEQTKAKGADGNHSQSVPS